MNCAISRKTTFIHLFHVRKYFFSFPARKAFPSLVNFLEYTCRFKTFENPNPLKVPKCEIFHLFDFNEFYGVKSL